MTDVAPRWEFRIFAPELGDESARLGSELDASGRSRSRDLYLVNLLPDDRNPKIRDGALDIKRLVDTEDGFERWRPEVSMEFPLDPAEYESLTQERPATEVDAETLADRLCRPEGPVAAMHVLKSRRHYRGDGVLAETGRLTVNGAQLETLAIESTDIDALARLRQALGLGDAENVSYVRQLVRLTGDARLPADSPYRTAGIG